MRRCRERTVTAPAPTLASSATLPGIASSVARARALVRACLPPGQAADYAELCTSELATNAVTHSDSGLPGGTFTVAVEPGPAGVVITVTDAGSASAPAVAAASGGAEHGRGLLLVAALAGRVGNRDARPAAGHLVPLGRCAVTWRRLRRKARRWARRHPLAAFGAVVVLAAVLVHAGQTATAAAGTRTARPPAGSSQVIAYARAQIGKPYAWGGTGPDAYDCSGLVMEAFRQVGITFNSARPTADTEWLYGPHVTRAAPGDLVFFAGSDGTAADPGHVGIVVNPARHLMIDAYATGYPVTEETYGLPTSRDGLTNPVGFTAPGGAR